MPMSEESNVQQFIEANKESPVVSGMARGQGGQGATYVLADGRRFTLTREECDAVGHPKWVFERGAQP